jgi:hypothetical protein
MWPSVGFTHEKKFTEVGVKHFSTTPCTLQLKLVKENFTNYFNPISISLSCERKLVDRLFV